VARNAGGKNEGSLHYVVGKKYRKNDRIRPFHYVDENKRPIG
jgi:hypothetical protein